MLVWMLFHQIFSIIIMVLYVIVCMLDNMPLLTYAGPQVVPHSSWYIAHVPSVYRTTVLVMCGYNTAGHC